MADHEPIRISEAARQLGVSAQYLRLLEAEGKIPAPRRVFGYRAFSRADVARLKAMGVGTGQRLKTFAEVAAGG